MTRNFFVKSSIRFYAFLRSKSYFSLFDKRTNQTIVLHFTLQTSMFYIFKLR